MKNSEKSINKITENTINMKTEDDDTERDIVTYRFGGNYRYLYVGIAFLLIIIALIIGSYF